MYVMCFLFTQKLKKNERNINNKTHRKETSFTAYKSEKENK